MRSVASIPTLANKRQNRSNTQKRIFSLDINPNRTMLACNAGESENIATYRLPTLDPLCVGENGHRETIMGLTWLDDEFVVSGSSESRLALWRINEDEMDFPISGRESVSMHATIDPLCVRDVRNSQHVSIIKHSRIA